MKKTAIERRISAKIFEWLESIDDSDVASRLRANIVVTGGCITSMLLDEKVNDYDVYFRNLESCELAARYYVDKFKEIETNTVRFAGSERVTNIEVKVEDGQVKVYVKSAGVAREGGVDEYEYFELVDADEEALKVEGYVKAAIRAEYPPETGTPYRPVFLTANAITLSDGVQLVLRFYGKPSEIHENFDFTHCKNYWRSWGKPGTRLTLLKSAIMCTINRRLHFSESLYPLASLFRTRKFIKRGWDCSLGEMLKIAFALQGLDLTDPAVLQDQLVGMDAAYFAEVISMIRDAKVEKIDATFLANIIDVLY